MGSSKPKQVLGKTNNKETSGQTGTIKRAITTLAPTLLALGKRQVSIFHQQWEVKSWAHSSKRRGTWKLQAGLRARASLHDQHQRPCWSWKNKLEVSSVPRCYRARNSLFWKNISQRAPHPLGSRQCCAGLLYPTQHFWFLTHKSQIMHVWKWKASPQSISTDDCLNTKLHCWFSTYQTRWGFLWRTQ